MDEIKVSVVEFTDRRFYMMQYVDPFTGKKKTKSTRIERTGRKKDRTQAERAAAKWEEDIRAGRYQETGRITWDEFRDRYETRGIDGLAAETQNKAGYILDTFERLMSPKSLRLVTTDVVSEFQSKLRQEGKAEATIKSYLGHLRAALNWARDNGLIHQSPRFKMPKRAKNSKLMKGRPITVEEFERMLQATRSVVSKSRAKAWRRYLRGLWSSGLRLGESINLSWDIPGTIRVLMENPARPMFHIPAGAEKGNKNRLLPVSPELARLLTRIPVENRTGYVFDIPSAIGTRYSDTRSVGRVISDIGKKARVVVDTVVGPDGKEKIKFATAHDLRRAFGQRWSSKVMPTTLMELMRHETIETTMKFYVGSNAETTADILWSAYEEFRTSNTFGNSGQNEPERINKPK